MIANDDNPLLLTYLVESAHGYNLWSGRYEMSLSNPIDVAHHVAADLKSVLKDCRVESKAVEKLTQGI